MPVPNFGPNNNNNIGRPTQPPPAQETNKTESALRKWRRKALNRLRDGKEASCDFESVYISETLNEAIKTQLEDVDSPDGVHEIFESAITWREYP